MQKKLGKLSYQFKKGKAPAILFLHGWGSNHSVWTPYMKQFQDHTIIAPDFRGHGKSKEDSISLKELTNDINSILKKEKIKAPHVVGHSLGAAVALELAKKRKLKSLTTINLYTKRYAFGKTLVKAAIDIGSNLIQKAKRTSFQYYYQKDGKPIVNTLKLDISGTSKKTLKDAYKVIHNYEVDWKTNCPTLVIQGAYDPLASNHRLRLDTNNQKHVDLKVLPCHHNINTHKSHTVMQLLEDFWQ